MMPAVILLFFEAPQLNMILPSAVRLKTDYSSARMSISMNMNKSCKIYI